MKLLAAGIAMFSCAIASAFQHAYQPVQGLTAEVIASRRLAPPPPVPAAERAKPTDGQVILDSYGKRGFVMIGVTTDDGSPASQESNLRQGQAVGADLVLMLHPYHADEIKPVAGTGVIATYSSGTSVYQPVSPMRPMGRGTTTATGNTSIFVPLVPTRMSTGAVYFIKARFSLGVFVRDLSDAERKAAPIETGVAVRLIVDGTPAANADILVGDVIAAIDGVQTPSSHTFNDIVGSRSGQSIKIVLIRRGQTIEKTVQLNPA
jgi:hypothetical protein